MKEAFKLMKSFCIHTPNFHLFIHFPNDLNTTQYSETNFNITHSS